MNASGESVMTYHGTTILAVRHQGRTAVAGDGQITLNASVIKHRAKKVRRIYNDKIIVGFAGATADALSLSERLQEKLERYNGNLTRAAAELAGTGGPTSTCGGSRPPWWRWMSSGCISSRATGT
jgi:20S proteasome alpha/beta subunit